jgi:AcrR family transcriptional regulator
MAMKSRHVKTPTLNQRVKQASQTRRDSARLGAREAILTAAGQLLLESGSSAFSLRRVAERVGYTATTIYRHFADKDALLYAVTEKSFLAFTAHLEAAAEAEADPLERLASIAMAYIDFGLDNPIYYRTLFVERPDLLRQRQADRPSSRMESFRVLRAAVQEAVATGRTAHKDGLAISNALWAQTHGTVALALAMPHMPAKQARAFGALGVTALIRGLEPTG